MPTDHGFRADHDESLIPARPKPSCQNPEKLIERAQLRSRMPSFQHGELLPEDQVFQQKSTASMKTLENSCHEEPNCAKHCAIAKMV